MARTASNDLGAALEGMVAAAAEYAQRRRLARIYKVPTPIRQLERMGPTGTFVARHQAAAHVDFYGAWLEGAGPLAGMALAVECKATLEPRFVYSGIEPQQRDWLSDTRHSFVVVHFAAAGQTRAIWWPDFAPKTSVTPDSGLRVDVANLFDVLLAEARRRVQCGS